MSKHTDNLLFSIGHSNHPIERFLALLKAHEIELLVDVRTLPRSSFNAQFVQQSLAASLTREGVQYKHMPALGGMRQPRADSKNLGWEPGGFRGYADYMQTPEFAAAIDSLKALANQSRLAIMCAEAAPLHCHRALISDALIAQAWQVVHILPSQQTRPHVLTEFAVKEEQRVTYPARCCGDTADIFAV